MLLNVAILILLELTLQYPLNEREKIIKDVAILILLELTLQFLSFIVILLVCNCRNPYFIGINSAIVQNFDYFQCFDI